MILYHGSADIVNTPEIRSSNRALDYDISGPIFVPYRKIIERHKVHRS